MYGVRKTYVKDISKIIDKGLKPLFISIKNTVNIT